MSEICFINGEYKSIDETEVKVDNIGLLRGYGIFEYFITYNGKLFRFDQHMSRFFNSAEVMSINSPYDKEEIRKISKKLKDKNNFDNCSFRIVMTGGRSTGHTEYDPDNPTFIIICKERDLLSDEHYEKGVELLTLEHKRIIPEVKYTNYILPISKRRELEEKEKYDFLYTWQGKVLESVTSSFFLVKDGKLITPKNHVLPGTTREFVIEITKDNFEIERREVSVEELKEADEAFLTATNKEVLPVVKVDEIKIGNGKVGKVTKIIMKMFEEEIDNF